jgi:hypothetical protein
VNDPPDVLTVGQFHLSFTATVIHLPHDLVVDEHCQLLGKNTATQKSLTLELFLGQRILVLVKVKEFLRNRVCSRLIVWIVVWLKVRVLEGILNGDTLSGVEGEKLVKEIKREVIDVGEHDLPGDLLLEREGADVLASTAGLDTVVVLHCWRSEHVKNESKLVMIYHC